jgi:RHH-type rel operon transcriptional repressor/antitoxin RelB
MLVLRLPPDVEQRLTDLAQKTGRTKTYYARKAIVEALEDMEDVFLAAERLRATKKVYTVDEAFEALGLTNVDSHA